MNNIFLDDKTKDLLREAAMEYLHKQVNKPAKVYLRQCPICGEKVNLCFYGEDAMRTYVNYEEELDELDDVYGFIHCFGCDSDFYKTASATLRELIEWWNNRDVVNKVLEDLTQLQEDYKCETNSGFIDMCIDIVDEWL